MNILAKLLTMLICVAVFGVLFFGTLFLELGLLSILDFSFVEGFGNFQFVLAFVGIFIICMGVPIYFGIKVSTKIYKFFNGLKKEDGKNKKR